MNVETVPFESLRLSPELARSSSARAFEDRLRSSIETMGLAEPLKIAPQPDETYVVIDGAMRYRAIRAIREKSPARFETIAVYVFDYERRFEVRYQSDIYQDLLPSQMAALVEHLHRTDNLLKTDIARYIGVSPATLRNYTGLWRLMDRGGLFSSIVDLMDAGVFPASNPFAWLRLTGLGLRNVLEESFAEGSNIDRWVSTTIELSRQGRGNRFPIKYVEAVTSGLPPNHYRVGEEVRLVKRNLGLRRNSHDAATPATDIAAALRNLEHVASQTTNPLIRSVALSLDETLR